MVKKLLFIFALVISMPVFAEEPAGQIVDFVGEAWITTAGHKAEPAAFKRLIHVGDTVVTKETGAVKILFADDTLLTVKENSKTLITEFLFQPEAKQRRAIFKVLFGKVRTVVGKFFGEDQRVEVQSPTAVCGIRGTDVGTIVNPKSTLCYCFDGVFEAFNIMFPEKIIKVAKGKYTEILEGIPPLEPSPIPEDVWDQKDIIFDITLSSKPGTKEEKGEGKGEVAKGETATGQSAAAQVVQTTRKTMTTEATPAAVTTKDGTATTATTATGTTTSSTTTASTKSSSTTTSASTTSGTTTSTTSTTPAVTAPTTTTAAETLECQTSLLACGGSADATETFTTATTPVETTSTPGNAILPGAESHSSNIVTITITL